MTATLGLASNVMGSGFRTFQSGEILTADNVQNYLMDQAVMVFAGTAARSSALPSPEVGMTAYSTATGMQVWDGSAWVDVGGVGYGVATGGTSSSITVGGVNYTLLTFTSSGTLTVTKAGRFDFAMTHGGGGSGSSNTSFLSLASGGAGGGGYQEISVYLSGNEAIVVGAGGSGGQSTAAPGTVGGQSGVLSLFGVSFGGGLSTQAIGGNGVCGGGGGYEQTAGTALYNDANRTLGYAGGAGSASSTSNGAGGGGGGATAVGAAGVNTGASGIGGNGGAGFDVSAFIGGSTLSIGGGGGGGGKATGGTGSGGGGDGGTNGQGTAGTANRGGGGGGATNGAFGRNGGSGIVYVRFKV